MERQEINGLTPDLNSIVDHVIAGQAPLELTRNSIPVAVVLPVRKRVLIRDLNAIMAKAPRLAPGDAEEYLKDIREAIDSLPQELDRWES